MSQPQQTATPWYQGISRYQWLVLIVASLGWVFDVFEGQIFVASMREAMPALLPAGGTSQDVPFYTNITFAAFLLGGALGGVLFGMLSDRLGRKRTLTYTILTYSLFTCLSAFASTWWEMAIGKWAGSTVCTCWRLAQPAVAWRFWRWPPTGSPSAPGPSKPGTFSMCCQFVL